MLRVGLFVALITLLVASVSLAQDAERKLPIRKDHPRILFNKDQLPAIRKKVEGPFAEMYAKMKAKADKRVNEILTEGFVEKSIADLATRKETPWNKTPKPWDGLEEVGLLWHLTGEEKYKKAGLKIHELMIRVIENTIEAVNKIDKKQAIKAKNLLEKAPQLPVSYDLFYNELEEPDRKKSARLGVEIIRLNRKYHWGWSSWENMGRRFHGPTRALPQIMGFYHDATGEDAKFLNDLAAKAYDSIHSVYLPGFAVTTSDRGGWNECFQCVCMEMSHEMPFWWRWRNATTAKEHKMYITNPLFTGMGNWIVYNVMDWHQAKPSNYKVPIALAYDGPLGQNGTYWTVPLSRDSVGAWFAKQVPQWGPREPELWDKILVQEPDIPLVKPEELPETALFKGWGWVSMRSDWSADAVFAHLNCGLTGQAEPADLDDTSFIIYHKGILALDGIKPQANAQNPDTYSRMTLGHNTITVMDPDEILRGNHPWQYTWRANPFPVNDGGQSWKGLGVGSRKETSAGLDFPDVRGPSYMAQLGWITGYQTTYRYDYTNMDGTNCYSDKKMKKFTRQFVFLKPNCFVVFDRVVSTKPEFRKRWHLHFQNEPTIAGRVVHADNKGGRLYCETLLPEKAIMKKVQGAKLEQADGSYVIPEGWKDSPTDTWRLDVGPSEANASDVFLHVLQAVDAGKPKTCTSRKIERNGMTGVEVSTGNRSFEVLFANEGKTAGHIKITENGNVVANRDFPQKIDDTYALWKNDPRFNMWMTDPRFRYTILPEDRKQFGDK